MSPQVSTSATTNDLPRTEDRPGIRVIYPDRSDENVSYTIKPHPPTPRDKR